MGDTRTRSRRLTDDELAALVDQRDFLLRSLDDLEAEHAAGDVDGDDYDTLKDDYTRRAAQVLRAIDAHQARVPDEARRRPGWRVLAASGGVLLFAVGAGVLVAQTAGQREAGDTITGDVRESPGARLAEANFLLQQRNFEDAVAAFDDVLAEEPDNVEAMTMKGWALTRSGDARTGLELLIDASELDPENVNAHAFLAITYVDVGRSEPALADEFYGLARDRLAKLDELGTVDPAMEQLLAPVRAEIDS